MPKNFRFICALSFNCNLKIKAVLLTFKECHQHMINRRSIPCFIIPLAYTHVSVDSTSIEQAVLLLLRSTNGISLRAMSFRPISCSEVTKSPSVRLGYRVSIKLSKHREGLGLFRKESRSSRETRSYRLAKRIYSRLKPLSSFLHIQSYTSICLAPSSSRVSSPEAGNTI